MITPQKAHARHHIRGDLRDARDAIARQHAERDEQTSAARDERDRAQSRGALPHLTFKTDCDAARERGEQSPDEIR
jgi:hypothetical protein